eukprot:CAMPEP_0196759006 /NCGR_PEP_ID=MMETSP1091-20130531/104482_1 /TAXON_ID=302021 /ORGANISM="Rhodomonas sp., Strain CCMP768" /LENGTH=264 /DNA_ID=CAMNT_0042107845 /DNA_START=24 /DNA_END=818 /DNA_ORIENTATION=+
MSSVSHLLVMDFEATCWDRAKPPPQADGGKAPRQEIIEFPCVVVETKSGTVVDEFHQYVKPTEEATLSEFCTELTGIEQPQVEAAQPLQKVLEDFVQWVSANPKLKADDFAIVTCGDWDLYDQIRTETTRKGFVHLVPSWMQRWINIKPIWMKATGNEKATGMAGMLRDLDIQLLGKHHSGIDDARNIARIALKLLSRGAVFQCTSTWPAGRQARKSRAEEKKQKQTKHKAKTDSFEVGGETGQAVPSAACEEACVSIVSSGSA